MTLILDEDMEDVITLAEFQNALEAYNCHGENHYDPQGSSYYASFQHRAMFKLQDIMTEKTVGNKELVRSCGVTVDTVNLKGLDQVLITLSPEFYQKDI